MSGDLLGLFSRGSAPSVSFDRAIPWGPEDLLVTVDDTLTAIAEKMERAEQIVRDGNSLAVAMGTLPRSGDHINYTKAAMDEMTPQEKEQYQAWAKGASLPALDPERDRAPAGHTASGRTRDERRLAWLKRAYKNEELVVENLAFFHKTYSALIPLLCAGAKVIGQERSATSGGARDARYLAEQVAAAKLSGAASARQNEIQAEVARLNKRIAAGVQALQARKEAMRPAEGAGRARQVPINEVRRAVGLPELGAVSEWRVEGAQGRGVRLFDRRPPSAGPSLVRSERDEPVGETGPPAKRTRSGATTTAGRPSAMRGRGRGGSRGKGKERAQPPVRAPSPVYHPQSPSGTPGPSGHISDVEM